jgi:hypothetical protein
MRITYIILGSVAAVVALVAAAAFLPKFTGPRSDIPISAADIGVTDGDTTAGSRLAVRAAGS